MILELVAEHLKMLQGLPIKELVILTSIVTLIMTLLSLPSDIVFERLRVRGFTKAAFSTLISGIMSVALLKFGLDLLKIHDPSIPDWVLLEVPLLAGLLTISLLYDEISGRSTFRWSRFFSGAVVPVFLAVFPAINAATNWIAPLLHS